MELWQPFFYFTETLRRVRVPACGCDSTSFLRSKFRRRRKRRNRIRKRSNLILKAPKKNCVVSVTDQGYHLDNCYIYFFLLNRPLILAYLFNLCLPVYEWLILKLFLDIDHVIINLVRNILMFGWEAFYLINSFQK